MTRPAVLMALFAAGLAADPLSTVMDRIDAASKSFRGMKASVSYTQHTAVLNDDDTETGTILVSHAGGSPRLLLDLQGGSSGARTMSVDPKEARIYNPKTRVLSVYDARSRQGLINQFFLLGFGGSTAEIKEGYEIVYIGEEKLGDIAVSHLALTPKSADMLRSYKRVELWIASTGIAVQQKFYMPSGDTRLAKYSNESFTTVSAKDLELNPKGATIQHPDR